MVSFKKRRIERPCFICHHCTSYWRKVVFFTHPSPPLSLQQSFAERIKKIEDLKRSMAAGLAEMENNYNALMQDAFGG
jgi:hypothetical protein